MSEARTFSYRNLDWHCQLEFYSDRVEHTWDKYGWGLEKGRTVILRKELSPHLSEGKDVGAHAKGPILTAGTYLILALFSFALLPGFWSYVGYLFIALFCLAAFLAITRLKRKRWLQMIEKDGRPLASMDITKWSDTEEQEFRRFYEQWMMEPQVA